MSQATITVAQIAPPAIGKKQGKVQDTNGGVWNVWADKLQLYREGVTYNIVYETQEFNGHQFNVIKTSTPANGTPTGSPQLQTGVQLPQPAKQQPMFSAPAYTPKDEMIFVCGGFNNVMGNPATNPGTWTVAEMIDLVTKLRTAWRNTFGARPSAGDDMNDSVPF